MSRAGWALLLAAATVAGGCGVKAPPRPPGGSDKSPPHDLFKPTRDSGPVAPEPILVGPQRPAEPPAGSDGPPGDFGADPPAPTAPAAPPQEPPR